MGMNTRLTAGSGIVYERLDTDTDLTSGSVAKALDLLGVTPARTPELVVPAHGYGPNPGASPEWRVGYFDWQTAMGIALRYGLRLRIDPAMEDPDEWYIEYGGRRVGSPGA